VPLPIVDCDVHEEILEEDVVAYLPRAWRDFLGAGDASLRHINTNSVYPRGAMFSINPFGYYRKDALPPDGGPAGSSPALMLEQLIEPFSVDAAVLTGGDGLYVSALTNPYFAAEVARAVNDVRADRWLAVDPRFKGSISLAVQVPQWAAEEVRRLADNPAFVQVCLSTNPHAHPFGHPVYDALHQACAETGRPFAVHSLGEGIAGSSASHIASGNPSLYVEYHGGAVQGMMSHIMSFIFHGVFERYPDLKLVILEPGGVGWIAPFLHRLDNDFKGLHREVPWCKRTPSEYFRTNVRVATQPYDHDSPDDPLVQALDALGAEDFLVFSSDYPHWDTDGPSRTMAVLPKHWREKVAHRNAAEMFGLEIPVAA
jgi:predicted TIM-barrel fold metal-dependent hydrolase